MKTGVDTCQARRIHRLHNKLLWTKLTFAKLAPEVQRSYNLQKFQSPRIEWHHLDALDALVSSCPGPPSERNYITTCHKMMLVSECCGLIAYLGDATRCLQPPVVFRIFEADAGQVRSLTSPRFQASQSRNWVEQIVHAAALETPESQIGVYI